MNQNVISHYNYVNLNIDNGNLIVCRKHNRQVLVLVNVLLLMYISNKNTYANYCFETKYTSQDNVF